MKVLIIGGGAAGFFAAINIAEKNPDHEVTLLEKTNKVLQKVKVSGGGRCNVTNARTKPSELVNFYPRGHKKLHSVLKQFSTNDMVSWLNQRGVQTKTEEDLRMFPASNDSQTIVDCFLNQAKKHKVKVRNNTGISGIITHGDKWLVESRDEKLEADKVIICTGSSPSMWKLLSSVGLEVTEIVPSLFTFNIKDERIKDLQGISFNEVTVKVTGTKLTETGPLLITHWGLSGPAVLKLSSWGAYVLNDKNYKFSILINYLGNTTVDVARSQLLNYKQTNPKRKIINYPLFELSKRFWERIITYCSITTETNYGDLSKKQMNKLLEELCQGLYQVEGKSTFKEEFVSAGGVKLSEVNLETFESKRFPGLYLAGEVLDIDALTGGFNFQACWSAGWIISENI